jgi:outer membrane receptor for ferrienterochelin and colicins
MECSSSKCLLKKANKSIVTDTDGNYIIKDLAAGDYEIAVSTTVFEQRKEVLPLLTVTETTLILY